MSEEKFMEELDNDEEVEISVKDFVKQFKKEHPVKFWAIVTGSVLTGTALIGGIAYLIYKRFGPKGTDEEETSEDWYEDKTTSEEEEN